METGLTKQQVISELTRSPHKDLKTFLPTSVKAVAEDPDFFSHLIAWNEKNGEIRDSKVALPVIALAGTVKSKDRELQENALAHMAMLDPRMFTRAVTFSRDIKGPTRLVRRLVERYLRDLEADRRTWERQAVQHRASLKTLYGRRDLRIKPVEWANQILFRNVYPAGSVFAAIENLKNMSALEAAGTIQKFHIPFLVLQGSLGAKLKEPDIALAFINSMSPSELTTNMKLLDKMGVKNNPALRGALETALGKASASKKNVLKTSKAATYASEILGDQNLASKMQNLQERQMDNLKNVEGNWLVMGDKSGSMDQAIILAGEIAAFLARVVKGKVHLVFFDVTPYYMDATGMSLEEIQKTTKRIAAGGGTSIGCSIRALMDENIEVDGIAIISDGGDNTAPYFHQTYPQYCSKFGKEPPVYLYKVNGRDPNKLSGFCRDNSIELQEFDLTRGADSYSLPNLISTMRTNRYGLVQAIQEIPFKTLDEVLKRTKGMEIFAKERQVVLA